MPTTNFSKEQNEIFSLALDLTRDDYSSHIEGEKLSKKDLENYLRKRIKDDMLQGRTLYQTVRRNNVVLYEIIEELVNVTIGEDVLNSPFIEQFVEIKNRALGDQTAFYSEGGLLSVASFAGNHWDTNRQALDLGEEFKLPKEWIYIHVYEELERFLLGIISIDKLMDKVYKSINKYIQDRIYAEFCNVSKVVPIEFTGNGNNEEAVGNLCDKVTAAGGYNKLTIAGTKASLRKLAGIVPDKTFANSQKEAKANTGSIGTWEGNDLLIIPQTLKSGTFDLAISDNQLFVMGGDVKPIKVEFFGDTRTKISEDGQRNNDQTIDAQIQTKMGMGMVMPPYFGVFNFSD